MKSWLEDNDIEMYSTKKHVQHIIFAVHFDAF